MANQAPQQPAAPAPAILTDFRQARAPIAASTRVERLTLVLLNYIQRDATFANAPSIQFVSGGARQNLHSNVLSIDPASGNAYAIDLVQRMGLDDLSWLRYLSFEISIFKNEKPDRIDYAIAAQVDALDIDRGPLQVNGRDFTAGIVVQWAVTRRTPYDQPLSATDIHAWDTPPLGVILYLLRRQSYINFTTTGGSRSVGMMLEAARIVGPAFPGMQQSPLDGINDMPFQGYTPAIQNPPPALSSDALGVPPAQAVGAPPATPVAQPQSPPPASDNEAGGGSPTPVIDAPSIAPVVQPSAQANAQPGHQRIDLSGMTEEEKVAARQERFLALLATKPKSTSSEGLPVVWSNPFENGGNGGPQAQAPGSGPAPG